ncbi:protein strawberry notch homolog 1-like [Paramacrobiotus metropolitanus]|uniref:protein strawberry notch homolog 1-like n=1 Tax=Paramacrobiotus metropolitanus TaxID=2943436 RepID=UPI002445F6F0|nr:protein strawberry notch homolog 1-like [Paramacrobiotus metropolitanus]XP_055332800.1 protein strawberry notch homolog 1-like [Paramacrobiotus metropolitanus]
MENKPPRKPGRGKKNVKKEGQYVPGIGMTPVPLGTAWNVDEGASSSSQYGPDGRPLNNRPGGANGAGPSKKDHEERLVEYRDEEDGLVMGETFMEYMPAKLKIGMKHPDHVVETTSLRSVAPPDIKYELHLPKNIIEGGKLSALQLEAVVYSCQQHESLLNNGTRAGFLIGDGAGVGKGRTIAGIILENYICKNKKSLWFSVSTDLKVDAERDLSDIGAEYIPVYRLEKQTYNSLPYSEGVMFATYSALISRTGNKKGKYQSRLDQLIAWCGPKFDGVIVFDECHRAKNLCPAKDAKPTRTGINVAELQKRLPGARIVYASATGASEPRNMGYMVRLGLWGEGTPFEDFSKFMASIDKRGVGAMELVAMEMKHRGMYIARQLSFEGVSFVVQEVELKEDFIQLYDRCCKFWIHVEEQFEQAMVLAHKNSKKESFIVWLQFWGTHQRFFKYLCLSSKVEAAVAAANKAVEEGKCAVIGLQSTGEHKTDQMRLALEEDGEELTDFISTARAVFMSLMERFPDKMSDGAGGRGGRFRFDNDDDSEAELSDDLNELAEELGDAMEEAGLDRGLANLDRQNVNKLLKKKKSDLIEEFETFADRLPKNMLDELVDQLGGADKVAEMTGRKGRMLKNEHGIAHYDKRMCDLDVESLNIAEKEHFMRGHKVVAIISEAASSGISLQADRRVANQRRRVHITLELAWSADRAIQQFGRTHRSNQTSAPEYVFLISNVAGEKRFASVVASRLERLGALTHGDRRVTETRDLSQFNITNKFGRSALMDTMKTFTREKYNVVKFPENFEGNFVEVMQKALRDVGLLEYHPKNGTHKVVNSFKIDKFMNRILGLEIWLQSALFQYFVDTLDAVVHKAKEEGKYDLGTMELGTPTRCAKLVKRLCFEAKDKEKSVTFVYTVETERGMSFQDAKKLLDDNPGPNNGFYSSEVLNAPRSYIFLAIGSSVTYGFSKKIVMFNLYRPNTGHQVQQWPLEDVRTKGTRLEIGVAERTWTEYYNATSERCQHAYLYGHCKRGMECLVGQRKRRDFILSGSVLNIWQQLERVFDNASSAQIRRMQIVRAIFIARRVIGIMLPNHSYYTIMESIMETLGDPIDDTKAAIEEMAKEEERINFTPYRPALSQVVTGSMKPSGANKAKPSTSKMDWDAEYDTSELSSSDASVKSEKSERAKKLKKKPVRPRVFESDSEPDTVIEKASVPAVKKELSIPSVKTELSVKKSENTVKKESQPKKAEPRDVKPKVEDDVICLSSDEENPRPIPLGKPRSIKPVRNAKITEVSLCGSEEEKVQAKKTTKAVTKAVILDSDSEEDIGKFVFNTRKPTKTKILHLLSSDEDDVKSAGSPKKAATPKKSPFKGQSYKSVPVAGTPKKFKQLKFGVKEEVEESKPAKSEKRVGGLVDKELRLKSLDGSMSRNDSKFDVVDLISEDEDSVLEPIATKKKSEIGSALSPLKTLNVDTDRRPMASQGSSKSLDLDSDVEMLENDVFSAGMGVKKGASFKMETDDESLIEQGVKRLLSE